MSDFFKSAMGYFNSAPNAGSGASNGTMATANNYTDNEFCGKAVDVGGNKLRIKRVIAEGGFAYVYVAQDLQTGKEYALKRLIGADKQACNVIINEINTHKALSGHPNIVAFLGASFIDNTTGPQQRAEYLLLTELCKGGSLIDCLNAPLEPQLVLRIFYQAARAVAHMHTQMPPIIHRDIKIENFLIGNDKQLKLCDFGSATKETFTPSLDWGAQQRNMLEDKLSSVTTPMYRAPEMLDTWSNYEIGAKVDIWALGCMLYVLCFQKHPFEDSAKLRILNGKYVLPVDSRFNCFHDIIKGCLSVNPAQRFNISMILERLASLAETRNWPIKGALELNGKPVETSPSDARDSERSVLQRAAPETGGKSQFYVDDSTTPRTTPLNRSGAKSTTSQAQQQQQQQHQTVPPTSTPANGGSTAQNANASIFSSLRGGAGSFLKNLKDTSSKVMQTMQQSIARNDLDISHITSRVLVMPCPSEGFESAYKTNNIEDVRMSIESRFPPQKVSVYNFGPRTCPRLPPPVRTVETGTIYACTQSHSPNLEGMFSVAEDMYSFLKADPKSVVIIQTGDSGGCAAATMVCALLMYADLISEPEDAVQVFAVKRHPINLRPSEFRYLYYFGDILRHTPLLPHYKNVNLVSLCCQPVPRMTKARDGCRIYIEVYCNARLLLSTVQEYEKMRLYLAGPGKITLPIDMTVCGELTIALFHARNALKGMVRPQGLKICQFQIHTGFIPEQETLMNFTAQDLDDLPDAEQVSHDFTASLSLSMTSSECPPKRNPPWIPAKPQRSPQHMFSTKLEYEEMVDNFVTKPSSKNYNAPNLSNLTPTKDETTTILKTSRPSTPLILPDVTEIGHDIPIQSVPEPSPPIDLLNLNQPTPQPHQMESPDQQSTAMPSSDASFDLLGAFGDDVSAGIGSAPIPDILATDTQSNTATALDDIFGSLGSNTGATSFNLDFESLSTSNPAQSTAQKANSRLNTTHVSSVPNSTNLGGIPGFVTTNASSKETSPQQPVDPFANIANLASGLNINFDPNTLSAKSAGTTPNATSPYSTQYSSPTHNAGIRIPTQPRTASPINLSTSNNSTGTANGSASSSTGNNTTQQMPRPDYSRNNFDAPKNAPNSSNNQSKSGDIFADILGEQGYKFGSKSNQGPRSINAMRKEDLIKDMDPDRVKIMEWTDGKKSNIRALLCSMHTVLWDDAKWKKCEMSTLITPTDVKKAYRRACLAVHPDKHNGTDNEKTAKLVFMELNNAWTDFENDATQQNIFST